MEDGVHQIVAAPNMTDKKNYFIILSIWVTGLVLTTIGVYLEPEMIVEFDNDRNIGVNHVCYLVSIALNLCCAYLIVTKRVNSYIGANKLLHYSVLAIPIIVLAGILQFISFAIGAFAY